MGDFGLWFLVTIAPGYLLGPAGSAQSYTDPEVIQIERKGKNFDVATWSCFMAVCMAFFFTFWCTVLMMCRKQDNDDGDGVQHLENPTSPARIPSPPRLPSPASRARNSDVEDNGDGDDDNEEITCWSIFTLFWTFMQVFGGLACLALLYHTIDSLSLPFFNFPLILSFTFGWSLGFYMDIVQVFSFISISVDSVVAVWRPRSVLRLCEEGGREAGTKGPGQCCWRR